MCALVHVYVRVYVCYGVPTCTCRPNFTYVCVHIDTDLYTQVLRGHMCVCVHTYVCVCVCMHIYIYIYILESVQDLYINTDMYVCMCLCVYIYTYMHIPENVQDMHIKHSYVCVSVCVCVYVYSRECTRNVY
jgi:hypothetical protein